VCVCSFVLHACAGLLNVMRAQNCVDIINAREWRAFHNLDADVDTDAHGLSVDAILVRFFSFFN
jgi:hypothetical protein